MKIRRRRLKRLHTLTAYSLVCAALVTMLGAQMRPAPAYAATCQSVAIPAYSYPNPPTFWDGAIAAHPPVSIMIANVNSGPGTTQDSNYVSVINKAQAAGIKVLGYVWTNYGANSTASVEADVDTWKSLYGVKNILFDGTSSAAADESYYQTITNYVHGNSGIVMLNPGTVPDEGYMNIGDIVSIFEGTQADYNSYTPPSWAKNYTSKIANIIFSVPDAAAMQSVLTTSQNDDAGYVYITDEGLPNPYSTLPAYWSTETSQINQNCTAPAAGGSSGSKSGGTAGKSASKSSTVSKTTAATSTAAAPASTTPKTSPAVSTTPNRAPATSSKSAASGSSKARTPAFRWTALSVTAGACTLGGIGMLIWRFVPLVTRHVRR